jgi:hypothetical protein
LLKVTLGMIRTMDEMLTAVRHGVELREQQHRRSQRGHGVEQWRLSADGDALL